MSDKKFFQEFVSNLQNDAALIETYKRLDDTDLDQLVQVIHDVFTANSDKMDIKLLGETCEIKLGSFLLNIKAMSAIDTAGRTQIVEFLKSLDEDQTSRFVTIQDYVGTNTEFLKMLTNKNALELIEIWYDVFVICFDEHLATIPNEKFIRIRGIEIPIEILKNFRKEQRLNIIFSIKTFSEKQAGKFKLMMESVNDQELYYKILSSEDDRKTEFLNELDLE